MKIMKPKPKYCNIRLSEELHDKLKVYCKEKGYNLSGYTEVAIKMRIMAEADTVKMETRSLLRKA